MRSPQIIFISVQITTSIPHLPAWVPGDATRRPAPSLPEQGIPESPEEEKVIPSSNVLVTQSPPGLDPCFAGASNICGPGTCVNLPDGYRCICNPGYRLHPSQDYCTDDNECLRNPCAGRGRCVNSVGSYSCLCYPGYSRVTLGDTQECQDIDECRHPGTCPDGRCVNSPGSYTCLPCEEGYIGQSGSCVDVNECLTPGICAHGSCINMEGSFRCSCDPGYEVTQDKKDCRDVDECVSRRASCPTGLCLNTEGSFTCEACQSGYWVNEDGTACEGNTRQTVTERTEM
ncbi:Latent-transforming growth factor beta-binding protein 2 [Cricetulus griseus]|uniref:Latent-transforming growth factor beta-binding protein 2 n=1 Tax=Cricetulus griseus TaxID=10029 RepID=G3I940_CRIGR|nr:Latent-transforming growth factor beta-binding protein 2 [Cricetulus griseus]